MPRVSVTGGTPRVVKIGGSNAVDATARQTSQEALSKANQNATDIENGVFSGEDNVARQTANEALVKASSAVIAYNTYQDFADERLIGLPDSQEVLIRQDERNGGATVQGISVEVEAYNGGGDAGTVTIVDAQARASAAAAQSTANIADGKADALDTRVTTLEDSGGGGGATIDDASTSTTTVWSSDKTSAEIAAAAIIASNNSWRTLESFNTSTSLALDFDANPTTANETAVRTAMEGARDFCLNEGGQVTQGGGLYPHGEDFLLDSYFNLKGMGMGHSHNLFPSDSRGFYSENTSGNSIYRVSLEDFTITHRSWNPNLTVAQADARYAIDLDGSNGGPDDPVAVSRESLSSAAGLVDPYHEITRVRVYQWYGSGVRAQGRGEIKFRNNVIERVAGRGLYTTVPDTEVSGNTINQTGYDGWYCNSGKIISSHNGFFYIGMSGAEEGQFAGIHLPGAGKKNFTSVGDRIQDCMQSAMILNGDHVQVYGMNADGMGGGRIANAGQGWTGTRTEPRCVFLLQACNQARIFASCGSISGAPLAHMVNVTGANARANEFHLHYDTADNSFETPYVQTTSAFADNKHHLLVMVNGDIAWGKQAQGDLGLASAGFNQPSYRPAQLTLTNGKTANWTGAEWAYPVDAPATVTPA